MKITRRTAAGSLAAATTFALEEAPAPPAAVALQWLDGTAPALPCPVSWGVPWPRGAFARDATFQLSDSAGAPLPLQSWPLAFWPDGSLKWSGCATIAPAGAASPFRLQPGAPAAPAIPLRVTDSRDAVELSSGALQCRVPKSGPHFLSSLTREGRLIVRDARLVCTLPAQDFTSDIRKVTVEQSGPIRATIKVEGVHRSAATKREWLPFVLRLYFYAGSDSIRLVHTFVFDGDEQQDFIHGLGLAFTAPLREQVHNRHVRFSGEGAGLWAEPLQPLVGRRNLPSTDGRNPYAEQLAGRRVPDREAFNPAGQKLLADWAVWDSFKLTQLCADGFRIQKRTGPQSCWLAAGAGRRASGLVFAGDVSGGLAVAVKNFWQSFPASLEISGATGEAAELRVWLWSPDAEPMDLRHYDTRAHDLDSSYEDVQPGFSTPHGIARTSELTLFACAAVPTRAESVAQAAAAARPPLLTCIPRYLHDLRAFGIWSLPDRSTPFQRGVEDQLDAALSLYQKEVEQRRWYGFWDFGDVMHAYDPARHAWRYDVGGFAWDNTELGTDLWLWYSFLRSGRADVFRMAEAMTRHTSEVDCYHLGRFALLGSRHNVRHWGCGAKELRISQALYRRFYYYLSTDERTGDLMREVRDADFTLTRLDPMRIARPLSERPSPYPARIRGGPDWLAVVSNWMTEWERTGDSKYRGKILAGMDSIAAFPYGFLTGPECLYGYDPSTGKLYPLGADPFGIYNLTTIMGGAQLVFELNELIDHSGWKKAWLQYCRLERAPKDVVARDMSSGQEGADARYAGPGRLAAYVYHLTRNPAFARRAWTQLTSRRPGAGPQFATRRVEGPDVLAPIDEYPGVSTNNTAQWSLNAIEILEMCASQPPE